MTPARRFAAITGWLVFLVVAVALLTSFGHGRLAAPPLSGGARGLRSWARTRDAATIFMTVLRVVALAAGWYLIVTTVAGVVTRLTALGAAVRMTDAVTIPLVRWLLGASTAVVVMAGPAVAGAVPPGTTSAVAVTGLIPARTSTTAVAGARPGMDASGAGDNAPPTLREVTADRPELQSLPLGGPVERARVTSTTQLRPDAPAAPTQQSGVVPPAPVQHGGATLGSTHGDNTPASTHYADEPSAAAGASVWTVHPGESLWTIARISLTRAWNRSPTAGELAPYWAAVVAANPLPDPNLIYPGQSVVLPPAPPAP